MAEEKTQAAKSVDSIIWDNWGIVEVLLDRRSEMRDKILEALENAMKDEENLSDVPKEGEIVGDVKRRTSGRGVETKYSMQRALVEVEAEENVLETISLGAITIDFPNAQDNFISLEVWASLPQQRIFGNGLDEAKQHIRKKVEAMAVSDKDEVVNKADLESATGRNDIAKRIINASKFGTTKNVINVDDEIDNFVSNVMGIYKIYRQIPRWLAELPPVQAKELKGFD